MLFRSSGIATTWTLAGSTTAYAGTLATDGYQLTASAVWQTPAVATLTGETFTATSNLVMGTCVETLTTAGAVQAATVTDNGNFALCHFVYYTHKEDASVVNLYAAQTGTYDWGATLYLTATQWGTAGSGLVGNTMNASTGGTAITTATWGMALTPAAA